MFLYDFKCFDSEKHLKFTGVKNDLILENLKRLLNSDKNFWIRIPLIAGFNDTEEEMCEIKNFLEKCKKPQKIEFLPYHKMGEHKYAALGKKAVNFEVPKESHTKRLKEIFGL